ncbi:MAG: SPFH domain-containing protein, partial [Planctomycetota bacterium]
MHREYRPTRKPPGKRPVRWLRLLPWLLAIYVLTGLYTVQPNERAVVRRCGQALSEVRPPGLHFGLPYGIDRVTRLKRSFGRRIQPAQSECLTGDHNLILVSAVVQYHVDDADPKAYLLNVADVPTLVSNVAASELTAIIASMNVDDVLTVQRTTIQNGVMRNTQATLDRYGAGARVTSVSLEEV